tara:strand:+ start:143 stop:358 length:216 start_codon:yes stop_codon:yes gene_type:complete
METKIKESKMKTIYITLTAICLSISSCADYVIVHRGRSAPKEMIPVKYNKNAEDSASRLPNNSVWSLNTKY